MKLTTTLIALFTVFSSFSQLITTIHPSPVIGEGQGGFLGPNYNVISSSYTGAYYSLGHFDASNTTLGVNKGILLTTGVVVDNGFGPHGPNDLEGCSTNNGIPSDQSIAQLYLPPGNIAYDMVVFEIEFVPMIDSLKIKFVFASEEYPRTFPGVFNDFVAVQLMKNNDIIDNNIASVNNGGLVSVRDVNNGNDNVGPCNSCLFYQQNGTGADAPYNSDNQYVQFDGFTKDTYIFADNLEIGVVHKIIIYLTDIGDGNGDSAVFLESCASCDFKLNNNELDNLNHDIKIYPNPAKETITIEGIAGTEYTLIDAQGKTLIHGILNQATDIISVSYLQSGVYFVRLKNENASKLEKLVID